MISSCVIFLMDNFSGHSLSRSRDVSRSKSKSRKIGQFGTLCSALFKMF